VLVLGNMNYTMPDDQVTKSVEQALRNVFGDGEKDAVIILKRIPLICQDIRGIHDKVKELGQGQKDMITVMQGMQNAKDAKDTFVDRRTFAPMEKDVKDIKDDLKWVVRIVLGAVIVAILTLLFKH
jgi:hypothetical protein